MRWSDAHIVFFLFYYYCKTGGLAGLKVENI